MMWRRRLKRALWPLYSTFGPAIYLAGGRRPWSLGYEVYKQRKIADAVYKGQFDARRIPDGYGFRLDDRIVEYPWFFSRIPAGPGTMLDAGSVLNYDYLLAHPRLASKRVFISTLAPEADSFWRRGISYVYEDLRRSCFRDEYFDWIVSLSTVEHIGMDNTVLYTADPTRRESDRLSHLDAIREFRRMLAPGGKLFLSLPFGRAEDHGWLQLFDASMIDRVVATFSPVEMTESHFLYKESGWTSSDRDQSKEASYFDIHRRKDYPPDFLAASRAIVCLELTK
jgi:SAM-dependent methyltransferase